MGEDDVSSAAPDYYFAKFNVMVNVPEYTDEEYENHLQHPDWSKDETDYLFDLCRQYDLRWIIIGDRYDYQVLQPTAEEVESAEPPSEPTDSLLSRTKPRTVEYLKARYYQVSAALLALRRPVQDMTPEEFAQHEILAKYSASTEMRRKEIATNLANRTSAEVEEEAILLTELRRIISNQDRLALERSEIYSTLESPPSNQNSAVASLYQSSAGLSQLMQILLQADKNKKRRSLLGLNGESGAVGVSSPIHGHTPLNQRDIHNGPSANPSINKKGPAATQVVPRSLSSAEEARYGVSYHEKLAAGTALRHERAMKLAAGKSHVQSLRVSGALTELEIPARLVMPTAAVCEVFEHLIQKINVLLDVRKQRERVEGEVRVLEVSKGVNVGDGKNEETTTGGNEELDGQGKQTSESGPTNVESGSPDVDMGDGETPASLEQEKGQKRSTSVVSQASQASTRRSRK